MKVKQYLMNQNKEFNFILIIKFQPNKNLN